MVWMKRPTWRHSVKDKSDINWVSAFCVVNTRNMWVEGHLSNNVASYFAFTGGVWEYEEGSIGKEESACLLAASGDTALKIEFACGGAVRRRRPRPVPLPAPSLCSLQSLRHLVDAQAAT